MDTEIPISREKKKQADPHTKASFSCIGVVCAGEKARLCVISAKKSSVVDCLFVICLLLIYNLNYSSSKLVLASMLGRKTVGSNRVNII